MRSPTLRHWGLRYNKSMGTSSIVYLHGRTYHTHVYAGYPIRRNMIDMAVFAAYPSCLGRSCNLSFMFRLIYILAMNVNRAILKMAVTPKSPNLWVRRYITMPCDWYIYTYIHMYTVYIYICLYMHICIYEYVCIYACVYMYIGGLVL